MRKLADLVIRYRIFIIVIAVLLTGFFGYQLKNITINSDILSYLSQDDPHVMLFNEVGDKFGGNSLAMVALESDNAFSYANLTRVNEITRKFKEMNEVSNVMSLTDILDIKKTEWGLEVGKLIDNNNIPKDPEELKRLRNYTLSKDMYRGSLVSNDGKIAVIVARLKEDADKIATGRQMRKIVESTAGKQKIYYGGIPFQMIFLVNIIQSDIVKLVPIVILLVMGILFMSYRSLRGVFLPLSCVLMSTVWVMGIMSLLKVPLTIISDGMPVLLIAIGSAYGIHMLSKYNEDVSHGDSKIEGIKDALSEVGIPIILASVTTLIGFLAFLSSSLGPIREFGIFASIGVAFAMIISVTFLPAVLSFLRVKRVNTGVKGTENDWSTRTMDKLAGFVLRNTKLILVGFVVMVIFSLLMIPKMKREVNMVDYFKKGSEIRQAEEIMENRLGGSIPVQILVKGDLKDPFVLKEMLRLEKFLDAQPDIHDPQSITDLICEMNWVMNGHYTIPDTREGVVNLWFFLDGNEVLDQLVTKGATEGLIQAKLGTVNTKQMLALVKAVDNYIHHDLRTDLITTKFSIASPDLAAKLTEERVERILSLINWDIQKRGLTWDINNPELKRVIAAAVLSDSNQFDNALIDAIADKTTAYLKSEETDILIESDKIIAAIINKIENSLRLGKTSEDDISTILRKVVPSSLYVDNPDVLDYTSESIGVIIADEISEERVNHLILEIKPYLPDDLADDENFLSDLRDDVWEINENQTAISYSKYTTLTGETDTESRTKLSVKQTGMPIIYVDLDKKIIKSQAFSLFIAISLVFLILSYRLKSVIGGLISITPIILTILVNFTIMAIFRIPLDIVTALIGSVAVGIGIDYTIHFTSRYKTEHAQGKTELEALDKTLETTGKAIIINALSVMMGFLVLLFGEIVPMQRFGYLIALTMLISALASITILPSLLLITKAKFIGNIGGFEAISNKFKRK